MNCVLLIPAQLFQEDEFYYCGSKCMTEVSSRSDATSYAIATDHLGHVIVIHVPSVSGHYSSRGCPGSDVHSLMNRLL